MLFFFLLQLIESQSQFTNIEKSFTDKVKIKVFNTYFIKGWTMLEQDQNLVNDQLCDQINHTTFFSPQAGMIKLVKLPPHNKIEITYQVVVVGTPDQENPVHGWVDQDQIDLLSNTSISNCQIFQMSYKPLIHYAESALILIKGNGADKQLWGIRDFKVDIHNCPNSCQKCDQEEQCEQWKVILNETYDDSSDSIDSIFKYRLQNEQMNITQQQQSENHKSWISFLYISFYEDDKLTLQIDDDIKTYRIQDLNYPNIINKLKILRVHYQYDNQLTNKSKININSSSNQWGIRDLYLYTAKCQFNCKDSQFQIDETQNYKNDQILSNSLLSLQSQAIEVIFDRQLYDVELKNQFYYQYNVINGMKGRQITSTLNGGNIIGGFEIFDIHTKVEKNYYHISKPHSQQGSFIKLQFKFLLYLIGDPYPTHQFIIQFWKYYMDNTYTTIPQRVINFENHYMGDPQEDIVLRAIYADDGCFEQQKSDLLKISACQIQGQIEIPLRDLQFLQFKIKFDAQEHSAFTEPYEDTINNVYWGFDDLQIYYQPKTCSNKFLSSKIEEMKI